MSHVWFQGRWIVKSRSRATWLERWTPHFFLLHFARSVSLPVLTWNAKRKHSLWKKEAIKQQRGGMRGKRGVGGKGTRKLIRMHEKNRNMEVNPKGRACAERKRGANRWNQPAWGPCFPSLCLGLLDGKKTELWTPFGWKKERKQESKEWEGVDVCKFYGVLPMVGQVELVQGVYSFWSG